mgnify:CR=1 FL=1
MSNYTYVHRPSLVFRLPVCRYGIRSIGFLMAMYSCIWSIYAQGNFDQDHIVEMPYFRGCEHLELGSPEKRECSNNAVVAFIKSELEYPEAARAAGVEGTVVVAFTIDENGRLVNPEVLRDLGESCGQAAIQVLQAMPAWEPAFDAQRKPVAARLEMPVKFSLAAVSRRSLEGYQLSWGSLTGRQISAEQLTANLQEAVTVRDPEGNVLVVDELMFVFEKGEKSWGARARQYPSEELQKIVKKAKPEGALRIVASVQDQAEFFLIEKKFIIVD